MATDSVLELLTVPFPESDVRYRPVVFCQACEAGSCAEHEPVACERCGQSVSSAHDCAPYVSHHEITQRLLDVDPAYFVRPIAFGPDGLPVRDGHGGLWVELVVHDEHGGEVARLGYGGSSGNEGSAGVATAKSYALRDAAEAFGIGHELKAARLSPRVPGRPGIPAVIADDPRSPLWQTISTLSGFAGRFTNREITEHYAATQSDVTDPLSRHISSAPVPALMAYIAALASGLGSQLAGGAGGE